MGGNSSASTLQESLQEGGVEQLSPRRKDGVIAQSPVSFQESCFGHVN